MAINTSSSSSTPSSTQGIPAFPPCSAGISEEQVSGAISAILTRMAPIYNELLEEARANPALVQDYRAALMGYYDKLEFTTPEASLKVQNTVNEALSMSYPWNALTKKTPSDTTSSEKRISVYSEDPTFDKSINDARLYIRFETNSSEILSTKEPDPLDDLLSTLSETLHSLGYQDGGKFDIRLEKGHLPLESDPWKWHFDGETLKTSITVCYSSIDNWSTRIADSTTGIQGKAAEHGVLYDAKNILHRAPIPADLEGKEIQANHHRLFIRYQEFQKPDEKKWVFDEGKPKDSNKKPHHPPKEDPSPKYDELKNLFSTSTPSNDSLPSFPFEPPTKLQNQELLVALMKSQSTNFSLASQLTALDVNQFSTSLDLKTNFKPFEHLELEKGTLVFAKIKDDADCCTLF